LHPDGSLFGNKITNQRPDIVLWISGGMEEVFALVMTALVILIAMTGGLIMMLEL
jgi:hypothetical protein